MPTFEIEREGQIDFYNTFLPRINPSLSVEEILADDNDGVLNGNLLEFKLNITDLNKTLFQAIKYLSARRIKGKPIPANIVLVDLNRAITFQYLSADYLTEIEKVYGGPASKANEGFQGNAPTSTFAYGENTAEAEELIDLLKKTEWTKINLDENCIVGWASAFYREKPEARKEDFLGDKTGKHKTVGEIRKPTLFADYINPYTAPNNIKFQYLMDKLNDTLQKKNLGAFYTPTPYANKSHELLRQAIQRVPTGNDYIILDRCAGTGNLEKALSDTELSHCILSTVEYYEYKVMQEVLGSKVRHIIPPIEQEDTFNAGLVRGADALSKGYIENPIIKRYIDDPKCTVILFENPPYAETTSLEHQRKAAGKKSSAWKQSYVAEEMKKEITGPALNDLGNVFIWSAFKFYLRQPTDSYIVYSPVKYWKAQHIVKKTLLAGFGFNRRHFHTNIDACVMCALWSNEDADTTEFTIDGYDLIENELSQAISLSVKKITSRFSEKYYDKTKFADASYDGILIGLNGLEADASVKRRIKPMFSENMLGYMVADSVGFDNPDAKSSLLVAGRYNGNGFFLKKDNYLSKLPIFCASRYITYNREWTERARIMKSADGAERYFAAVEAGQLDQWLRKCLLFTCLEMQNHMRTFTGSDKRTYRNELCLDTTNGDTTASTDLETLVAGAKEQALLAQWKVLMDAAKQTKEYNEHLTYGVYQIYCEIDTSYKDELDKTIYNNVEVHSALQTLKTLVKDYYITEIVPTLFEYEYLK